MKKGKMCLNSFRSVENEIEKISLVSRRVEAGGREGGIQSRFFAVLL